MKQQITSFLGSIAKRLRLISVSDDLPAVQVAPDFDAGPSRDSRAAALAKLEDEKETMLTQATRVVEELQAIVLTEQSKRFRGLNDR